MRILAYKEPGTLRRNISGVFFVVLSVMSEWSISHDYSCASNLLSVLRQGLEKSQGTNCQTDRSKISIRNF